jgi:hypothetical protein
LDLDKANQATMTRYRLGGVAVTVKDTSLDEPDGCIPLPAPGRVQAREGRKF